MIRESIKELAKTAHTLTLEQWDSLTLNTYERNYLYEFLPNEVLLKTCKQHNLNTTSERVPTTYNEAVIAILFPELIRRLEAQLKIPDPPVMDDLCNWMGELQERIYRVQQRALNNFSYPGSTKMATFLALKLGVPVNQTAIDSMHAFLP